MSRGGNGRITSGILKNNGVVDMRVGYKEFRHTFL
jgi:hypothetical protein